MTTINDLVWNELFPQGALPPKGTVSSRPPQGGGLRPPPTASPAKRVAVGEEEQRNERAFGASRKRGIWSLLRRGAIQAVQEVINMKVRPSVKPMCEKCKIIKRKGKVMVICENPKHKQRQG